MLSFGDVIEVAHNTVTPRLFLGHLEGFLEEKHNEVVVWLSRDAISRATLNIKVSCCTLVSVTTLSPQRGNSSLDVGWGATIATVQWTGAKNHYGLGGSVLRVQANRVARHLIPTKWKPSKLNSRPVAIVGCLREYPGSGPRGPRRLR